MDRVVDIASAAIKHLENVTESADLDESGKIINWIAQHNKAQQKQLFLFDPLQ